MHHVTDTRSEVKAHFAQALHDAFPSVQQDAQSSGMLRVTLRSVDTGQDPKRRARGTSPS